MFVLNLFIKGAAAGPSPFSYPPAMPGQHPPSYSDASYPPAGIAHPQKPTSATPVLPDVPDLPSVPSDSMPGK